MTSALAVSTPEPTATAFAPTTGSMPVQLVTVPVLAPSELDLLLEKFLKSIVQAHHLTEMTAISYRWKLGHFFAWLRSQGVETIGAITYGHFEDYLTERKWASPLTSHKFACQCRQFVRWCKARGVLPTFTPWDTKPEEMMGRNLAAFCVGPRGGTCRTQSIRSWA